ncbi:hypothetical protein JR316_0008007 [Psilocybe cubensis]|uniref:SAP domain-containing protein n=2 Tax=Psilocybe cubensis TaxID=181762 RepID=A0A8H7XUV5_PSICU|nr:hypothetical protein JR316_0008007 [Psilocybe cubensis]KAH9479417.1 hypothetical protein JR316_0008007 [Psilocybe cubensis]
MAPNDRVCSNLLGGHGLLVLALAFALVVAIVVGRCCTGASLPMEAATGLPFPGPLVDGEGTIQFFDIDSPRMTKTELVGLCRGFGLPKGGKKDELKARLRAFSENREEWIKLQLPARRMHRGPKEGKIAKAKSVKQSARRAGAVFASTAPPLPHRPLPIPSQIATVPATPGQCEDILEWARKTSLSHPYVSREQREEFVACKLSEIRHSREISSVQTQDIAAAVPLVLSLMAQAQSAAAPVSLPAAAPVSLPAAPVSLLPAPAPSPCLSVPGSSSTEPVSPSWSNFPTRTLTLGTGVELYLNRMWDDTSPFWDNNSALVIKGHPIPIVYWKQVYARSKTGSWMPGQWKLIKGHWCQWKAIVYRWRQTTEDQFWQEFSDSTGERLSYRAIVDKLTMVKKEMDAKIAGLARQEFGDRFNSVFTYKKCGKQYVMRSDHSIASRYIEEITAQGRSLDFAISVDNDCSDMDLDDD